MQNRIFGQIFGIIVSGLVYVETDAVNFITHFIRSSLGFLMYATGLRLILAPARRPEFRNSFPGCIFSCAACMLLTTPFTTASRLSFTNPSDITCREMGER